MIRVAAPPLPALEVLGACLRGERPFLLDGGSDADGLGRYSFAGCDPDDGFVWRRGDAGDPLSLLEAAQRRWSVEAARSGAWEPRVFARDASSDSHGAQAQLKTACGDFQQPAWPLAVGFLSYDLGERYHARAPYRSVDDVGLPAVDFARYRALWRLDHQTGRADILAHDGAAAERLLGRLQRRPLPLSPLSAGTPRWEIGADEYRARIGRVLEYLHAGDAYQVCLAHRLRVELDGDGLPSLFARLRAVAPAPLGAYLQSGAATLLSNSPELLVRTAQRERGWRVESRPIKGTRPRGQEGDEDARLGAELLASPKDAAEHLMIVDLVRNDLGRVAEVGSVHVEGYRRRVELPTVHQLVSTVAASLRPGVGLAELLRAIFPGGSVTGAPKVRAMEIIDELEGVRRGPFCGALGWLGMGREVMLALPIRTAIWRAGELLWPVGSGIVADSDPDEELAETQVKAAALLRALG